VGGFLGAVLTGVFCTSAVNPGVTNQGLVFGGLTQVGVQVVAAVSAVVFAFLGSLVLAKFVDAAFGLTTDTKSETDGLDRTEPGGVGFDCGPSLEAAPAQVYEPRPASVPPDGEKRFTVVVEGADPDQLIRAWSDLCQVSPTPLPPQFRDVY